MISKLKRNPSTACTGHSGTSPSAPTQEDSTLVREELDSAPTTTKSSRTRPCRRCTRSTQHCFVRARDVVPWSCARSRAAGARRVRFRGVASALPRIRASPSSSLQGHAAGSASTAEVSGRGVDLQVGAAEAVRGAERRHRDTIKTAVSKSHLVDPELQRHLNLQAPRLPKYNDARKEAINDHRTKTTWNGGVDDPTDLTPLQKSQSNGRGKGRGKGDMGKDVCFHCGQPSHRKSECRVFLHDQERKCVVPDEAGKHANKPVDPATGQRLKPDVKSGDINSPQCR